MPDADFSFGFHSAHVCFDQSYSAPDCVASEVHLVCAWGAGGGGVSHWRPFLGSKHCFLAAFGTCQLLWLSSGRAGQPCNASPNVRSKASHFLCLCIKLASSDIDTIVHKLSETQPYSTSNCKDVPCISLVADSMLFSIPPWGRRVT